VASGAAAKEAEMTTTMYDHVGREPAIRRFVERFHESVLDDPMLGAMFARGRPTHVEHLTAFFVEVLGGPRSYSDELGGLESLLVAHRELHITEAERQRFVSLMLRAADEVGLPDDERFRTALVRNVEQGATFSLRFSLPGARYDPPYPRMPTWTW
jgi:hemoglobin